MANDRQKLVAFMGGAVALASAVAFSTGGEAEFQGVYPDPADPRILTACIGETSYVVQPGDIVTGRTFTHVECVDALLRRFGDYAEEIGRCGGSNLTTGQKIAFLDVKHNVGRFCGTSMAKRAKMGDVQGSCDAIYMWKYVGKVDCFDPKNADWGHGTCRGIVNRRNRQHARCLL